MSGMQVAIQPVCFSAINGEVCVGPDGLLCRWREQFEGVLNIISSSVQVILGAAET